MFWIHWNSNLQGACYQSFLRRLWTGSGSSFKRQLKYLKIFASLLIYVSESPGFSLTSDQVKFKLESLVEIKKLVVESKMTDAQKKAHYTFVIESIKN